MPCQCTSSIEFGSVAKVLDKYQLKFIEPQDSEDASPEDFQTRLVSFNSIEDSSVKVSNLNLSKKPIDVVKASLDGVFSQNIPQNDMEDKEDEEQGGIKHRNSNCNYIHDYFKENDDDFNILPLEAKNLKRSHSKKIKISKIEPVIQPDENYNLFSVLHNGEQSCRNEPRENYGTWSSYQLFQKVKKRRNKSKNEDKINISSGKVRNLKQNRAKKIKIPRIQPLTAPYENFNLFSVLDDGEELCKNEPRENPTSGTSYQLLLKLQTGGKRENESEIQNIARQYKVCKTILLCFKNVQKDKRSNEENKAVRKACYYIARMMDLHPEIQFLKDGTIREGTKKKDACECSNKGETDKRNRLTKIHSRTELNLMGNIQLEALMFIAGLEKKRITKITKRARQHEKKHTKEEQDRKIKYKKDNAISNFTLTKNMLNVKEEEVQLTKKSNKKIDMKLLRLAHQDTIATVDPF